MTKIALLMIGFGMCATSGCAGDWAEEELDQVEADESEGEEAELALAPEDVGPNAVGQFHLIRLANTQLCLQPIGLSTGDVEVELRPCVPSELSQNWLFSRQAAGDYLIINNRSGNCLYNNQAIPLRDGGGPITHGGCNVFGTNNPASNALWRPQTTTGLTQLMSRIQHRNSNMCFDVPNGNPFDGVRMWMYTCNGTPAQAWIVGVE